MENYAYHMIGEMLIGLGHSLQDENSHLRRHFRLSREQLQTLLGVIRLAASPDIQRKFLPDVASRFHVTEKTVRNWIDLGLVPHGHKVAHDTRHWWYTDELDESERNLIHMGYIKPTHHHHHLSRLYNLLKSFIRA